MQYIERELERKFNKMSGFFKAVLVTGARQVGKTTMLKHLKSPERAYVSLDDISARSLARRDPKLFFQAYRPPVLIDEVQKAPELFEEIKLICDGTDEPGLFWLTGSRQYGTLRYARESLAGRVGILELYGLSQREKQGILFSGALDFTIGQLQERQRLLPRNDVRAVFRHIWAGGMPRLIGADTEERDEYFGSYVSSYLMRDAAEDGGISDIPRFASFLKACAALTGCQVNYATLAEASGVSQPTAKAWLGVLQALGIVYLLRPYSGNALRRLVRAPKLYFCDTGLCAYLSMWPTPETLESGAASGAFFENYAVMELAKGFAYSGGKAGMSYYRDSNAKEIDVLVEQGGLIHPLEVKKAASPDYRAVKAYGLLDKAAIKRGPGGIICMAEQPMPIDDLNLIIPSNLI